MHLHLVERHAVRMAQKTTLQNLDDRFIALVRSWVWFAGLAVAFFLLGLVATTASEAVLFAIAALMAFAAGVGYGRGRS